MPDRCDEFRIRGSRQRWARRALTTRMGFPTSPPRLSEGTCRSAPAHHWSFHSRRPRNPAPSLNGDVCFGAVSGDTGVAGPL
jgi:hypothetical protein